MLLLAVPIITLGKVVGDVGPGLFDSGQGVEVLNGGMVIHVLAVKQLIDKTKALVDGNSFAQGIDFRSGAFGR